MFRSKESIEKLASREKFDDFFAGSFATQIDISDEDRRFERKMNPA